MSVEKDWTGAFDTIVGYVADAICAEEERKAREVVRRWLPRPLRRLVNRPKLLRLYLRLPHRTEPVCTVIAGEPVWSIQRRPFLRRFGRLDVRYGG